MWACVIYGRRGTGMRDRRIDNNDRDTLVLATVFTLRPILGTSRTDSWRSARFG